MAKKALIYVIQRHDASHLHYDLRLQMQGVLKSWAIPKEPVFKKGVKRLAVGVEDHPLGYEKFEGTIPEGQYGAGEVSIWDKGRYEILDEKPGRFLLAIDGKKLRGRYVLLKLKPKPGEKKDKNWLFFKKEK